MVVLFELQRASISRHDLAGEKPMVSSSVYALSRRRESVLLCFAKEQKVARERERKPGCVWREMQTFQKQEVGRNECGHGGRRVYNIAPTICR